MSAGLAHPCRRLIISNIFGACAMRLWNDDIIVMQNSATAMVVAVPMPLQSRRSRLRAYDTPNETCFILNQQVRRHGNATRDSVAAILT